MDTRIARWWSVDPRKITYPNLSPYVENGNSPLLFSDQIGDSLILRTPHGSVSEDGKKLSKYVNDFENMVEAEFNDKVDVNIDINSGNVTLNVLNADDLSFQQLIFLGALNQAISPGDPNAETIRITIVGSDNTRAKVPKGEPSSDRVVYGSFKLKAIDITDIKRVNSEAFQKELKGLVTSGSILIHEIVEQTIRQKIEGSGNTISYNDADNIAIDAENLYLGNGITSKGGLLGSIINTGSSVMYGDAVREIDKEENGVKKTFTVTSSVVGGDIRRAPIVKEKTSKDD